MGHLCWSRQAPSSCWALRSWLALRACGWCSGTRLASSSVMAPISIAARAPRPSSGAGGRGSPSTPRASPPIASSTRASGSTRSRVASRSMPCRAWRKQSSARRTRRPCSPRRAYRPAKKARTTTGAPAPAAPAPSRRPVERARRRLHRHRAPRAAAAIASRVRQRLRPSLRRCLRSRRRRVRTRPAAIRRAAPSVCRAGMRASRVATIGHADASRHASPSIGRACAAASTDLADQPESDGRTPVELPKLATGAPTACRIARKRFATLGRSA